MIKSIQIQSMQYNLAINHLPFKIPFVTIGTLAFSLLGCHFLGILPVQMGTFEPRILLLFSLYLAILSAIIYFHIKITDKKKTQIRFCNQLSTEEYAHKKAQQTETKLKELYEDARFKKWVKQSKDKDSSKSNIVYELAESDSEDEQQYITEHKVATMKKLF